MLGTCLYSVIVEKTKAFRMLYGIHSTKFSLTLRVYTLTYGQVRRNDKKSHTRRYLESDATFIHLHN